MPSAQVREGTVKERIPCGISVSQMSSPLTENSHPPGSCSSRFPLQKAVASSWIGKKDDLWLQVLLFSREGHIDAERISAGSAIHTQAHQIDSRRCIGVHRILKSGCIAVSEIPTPVGRSCGLVLEIDRTSISGEREIGCRWTNIEGIKI